MTSARGRNQGGIATVEVALTAPALLFAVMLVIQYALLFHAQAVALAAAEEGAATARAFDGSTAAARAQTLNYLDQLGSSLIQGDTVVVLRTAEQARVTVTGTVISVVPGLDLGIAETAGGPVERFEPPA